MPDNIETAIEVATEMRVIRMPRTAAVAVVSLATYGASELTLKAVRKAQQIRANRKAKKALAETEPRRSEA